MLYLVMVRVAASSPICYTTTLVTVRVAASSPVHAHACSHVSCIRGPYAHARRRMCTCTCHVQRMRVSHMRAWCWPAPRSHARPRAAWSSRLGPQQALASPGLGFERRLSAAVLDRACPDWKRPHSQATAWCMARCMARRSQGAGWSQGEGGALEVPWVSQLVGTARVRVKRVAAGGCSSQ